MSCWRVLYLRTFSHSFGWGNMHVETTIHIHKILYILSDSALIFMGTLKPSDVPQKVFLAIPRFLIILFLRYSSAVTIKPKPIPNHCWILAVSSIGKLNRIGKDYIITIRICTVVVVLFFTRLQGARTALAKRELHWYLPNRVRQIPTICTSEFQTKVAMGLDGMHQHHHSSHFIFLPSFLLYIRSISHHRYTFCLSIPPMILQHIGGISFLCCFISYFVACTHNINTP